MSQEPPEQYKPWRRTLLVLEVESPFAACIAVFSISRGWALVATV